MNYKEDNFFWCEQCDCVSYDYECSCGGTWCNCGGCEECKDLREHVEFLYTNNKFPSEEVAASNNIKKFGGIEKSEQQLLKEIFGEDNE